MKPMFHRLLAMFFALWLPLSAVAAATMPICVHETTKQAHAAHAMQQAGEQHHQGCPEQEPADDGAAVGECGQCGLCLFAATPWLPGTQSPIVAIGW